MSNQKAEKKMGPGGYALTGAGVGAAGAGSTVGLMGLATGLAVLPITVAVGVVGGLAWWAARSLARKANPTDVP